MGRTDEEGKGQVEAGIYQWERDVGPAILACSHPSSVSVTDYFLYLDTKKITI